MSQPSSTPKLSLVHLVRPPRTRVQGQPPLLIQLHGVGSHERDLFEFADLLDPRFLVVSARAPLVVGPDSFAWFDVRFLPQGNIINVEQLRASLATLVQFIGEAVQGYQTDPQRVYLLGFSQGGIMGLSVALTHPALVAGVAAMSARVPPEVVPAFAPKEELTGLPLLLTHGTEDMVIPIRDAREGQKVLADLPVDLTYHEYEMGHQVTPKSLDDVLAWLTARLNGPRRTGQPG
jgi:phospholipase/carboxylesterase